MKDPNYEKPDWVSPKSGVRAFVAKSTMSKHYCGYMLAHVKSKIEYAGVNVHVEYLKATVCKDVSLAEADEKKHCYIDKDGKEQCWPVLHAQNTVENRKKLCVPSKKCDKRGGQCAECKKRVRCATRKIITKFDTKSDLDNKLKDCLKENEKCKGKKSQKKCLKGFTKELKEEMKIAAQYAVAMYI